MHLPILSGIYADENANFRTQYPRNLIPVPMPQGISKGYLRPGDGIVEFATGPGTDRGGINWSGDYYRVMGTRLVKILESGTIIDIGDVGGSGQVSLDHSVGLLGIASNKKLYQYNGSLLNEITGASIAPPISMIWIDGYFMFCDSVSIAVTELNAPATVNPTKYGSSEVDPDPIKALLKLRNEAHALNRYTIEVFRNTGSSGFPFQRIEGGHIRKGTIGTHSCCTFLDEFIAFLGGGKHESPAVYLGANGQSVKISSREIDQILCGYAEDDLQDAVVEERIFESHQWIMVHLSDQTLVYDHAATRAEGAPVWFILSSGFSGIARYRARNLVWVYDKWHVGDPTTSKLGYLDNSISSHYGDLTEWQFSTGMVYNESNGALFHELELVSLPGRVALTADPKIYTQYSLDGETWSQEKEISAGKIGERNKRLVWRKQGKMRNYRTQRFRGHSDAHLSIAALNAELEPLAHG